jgi:hypothetical protein
MLNLLSLKRKKNIYLNGTYVSFIGSAVDYPDQSYLKSYSIVKSWIHKKEYDITVVTHNEKKTAKIDSSFREKLTARIKENIKDSEQLLIILNNKFPIEDEWIKLELEYAVHHYGLPIIVVYLDTDYILEPIDYEEYWPTSLKKRILSGEASCIHIPFKKEPFKDAVTQFFKNSKPNGKSLGVYSENAYHYFGISIPQSGFSQFY